MLSASQLTSSSAAGRYYQGAMEYYQGDENGLRWEGKGAALLGLQGFVEKEQFHALLKGELPHGQQLGRVRDGKIEHRPGFDLTFSAPKSFSILALMPDGDKRLLEIHDKAVSQTLTLFEKEFAQTRVVKEGQVFFEKTENLTVATLREATSREDDPNLHTHSVVMNVTRGSDGRFRALASDLSRAEGVYENAWNYRNMFGAVYRSILAKEVEGLGYAIEKTHEDGRFEINGVSEEVRDHFSKRRQQIESWLDERGLEGAKASQQATLATRAQKVKTGFIDLQYKWQAEAKQFGFSSSQVTELANQRLQETPEPTSLWERFQSWLSPLPSIQQEALSYALEHLSEREAVFKDATLRQHILAFEPGKIMPQEVKPLLEAAIQSEKLISIQNARGERLWTTPEALKTELAIIKNVEEGANKMLPIASLQRISESIRDYEKSSQYPLNPEQKGAIKALLNGRDSIMGVQGFAGTGKTTMLKLVNDIATQQGYTVQGIAPSAVAAKKLEQETGIPSITLSRVLINLQQPRAQQPFKEIYILDEASMASSEQLFSLTTTLAQKGIPLRVIGDRLQHSAISAGKPFSLMQFYGMVTPEMKTILRQRDEKLKASVYHAMEGEAEKALNKGVFVVEAPSKEERQEAMRVAYLSRPQSMRDETLFIVPTHKDREIIHQQIREGLKKEGTLHDEAVRLTTLKSRTMTNAQMGRSNSYQIGDVIRFNRGYESFGIVKACYFQVVSRDNQKQTLTLQNEQGVNVTWRFNKLKPQKGTLEVYTPIEREIQVGEKLRFRRNDKGLDVVNAQEVSVRSISKEGITLVRENGTTFCVDPKHPALKHIDYAYTHTDFSVQGLDQKNVVALMESQSPLANRKALYIDLSRGQESAILITDDKKALAQRIKRATGEKTSAIEMLDYAQIKASAKGPKGETLAGSWVLDSKHRERIKARDYQETLKQYRESNKTGRVVYRDRYANRLLEHHGERLTTEPGMGKRVLTQQARAHQRRQILIHATPEVRRAYQRVARYQALNRNVGRQYAMLKDKPLAYQQHVLLTCNLERRNQLAFEITRHAEVHLEALHHYGFDDVSLKSPGTSIQRSDDRAWSLPPRIVRLYAHASRIEAKETLKRWQTEKDPRAKQQLAQKMLENTKLHHGAVLGLGFDKGETWRSIRLDAKTLERNQLFEKLDDKAQVHFKTVERYVDARRAAGQMWREIFDAKAHETLPKNYLEKEAIPKAQALSELRDQLGSQIGSHPKTYQAGLDFFEIKPEKLKPALLKEEARVRINAYQKLGINKSPGSVLKRADLAHEILLDPKCHAGFIQHEGISWKGLGRDALIAEQREQFSRLSKEEKQTLRLIRRYKEVARQSGRAWSKVFNTKAAKQRLSFKRSQAARALSNQRNVLAAQLIKHPEKVDLALLSENVNEDKLYAHAFKHHEKEATLKKKIASLGELQKNVSTLHLSEQPSKAAHQVADWLSFNESELKNIKELQEKRNAFAPAAKTLGINDAALKKQLKTLNGLQKSMEQFLEKVIKGTVPSTSLLTQEQRHKLSRVNAIVHATKPIQGTLAERYLKEHRGIQGTLPETYRFHSGLKSEEKKWPALVVVGRNEENKLRAVQVIYLDPKTANKAPVEIQKRTFGVLSHDTFGVLVNQGDDKTRIAVTEGPETALSIREAHPEWRVYATLGISRFGRVPLDKGIKEVLICADNDGDKPQIKKMLDRAIETLSNRDVDVQLVKPKEVKTDFNDVLKAGGVRAVIDALNEQKKVGEAQSSGVLISHIQSHIERLESTEDFSVDVRNTRAQAILAALEQHDEGKFDAVVKMMQEERQFCSKETIQKSSRLLEMKEQSVLTVTPKMIREIAENQVKTNSDVKEIPTNEQAVSVSHIKQPEKVLEKELI